MSEIDISSIKDKLPNQSYCVHCKKQTGNTPIKLIKKQTKKGEKHILYCKCNTCGKTKTTFVKGGFIGALLGLARAAIPAIGRLFASKVVPAAASAVAGKVGEYAGDKAVGELKKRFDGQGIKKVGGCNDCKMGIKPVRRPIYRPLPINMSATM